MGQRLVSADIDADAERVFDLYTNAELVREWQAGVKRVEATGTLAAPGSRWTVRYGGPFSVEGTVLEAQRPALHRQRFSEMLGIVNCTTTARFVPLDGGTRATLEMDYRVKGGPVGRLFDDMLGREIVARLTRDLAGLKALAER